MKIVAFKWLSEKMSIERESMNGDTPEDLNLKDCEDVPSKSFVDALEAVRSDALKRLGLGAVFTKAAKVTGVRVHRSRLGHRMFSITGTVQGKYGPPIGFPFPVVRERVDSEEGETILSHIEVKRIDKLLAEALGYADGNRKSRQMELGEAQG